MTEDQKIRYRKLLSDQKNGKTVDFVAFQKEVEEENSAKKTELQNLSNWIDKLSSIYLESRKPLSWLNESVGAVTYAPPRNRMEEVQHALLQGEISKNHAREYLGLKKIDLPEYNRIPKFYWAEDYQKGWDNLTDYILQQNCIPKEFIENMENSSYASLSKELQKKSLAWFNSTIGG